MFYVHIVTNRRNGTLYTGMTDDIGKRIFEHKSKAIPGFTAKYGCDQPVWYEASDSREGAFQRERQIKEWKLSLIEEANPDWPISTRP